MTIAAIRGVLIEALSSRCLSAQMHDNATRVLNLGEKRERAPDRINKFIETGGGKKRVKQKSNELSVRNFVMSYQKVISHLPKDLPVVLIDSLAASEQYI